MKKSLFALIVTSAFSLSMFAATEMIVKLKNGEKVSFRVEDVEETIFEKSDSEEEYVDESKTFLEFKILSDSTVEVRKESTGEEYGCSYCGHDSIVVPQKVRIKGSVYTVTGIGEYAFYKNKNLTLIDIPKSITKISKSAFSDCSNLISIDIPSNVSYIGTYAFSDCYHLKNISLPSGITSIEKCSFENCQSMTDIEISSNVTSIGDNAFYGCGNLNVKIDNFEDSVTVGNKAFYSCKSVTWKYIEDSTVVNDTDTKLVFEKLTSTTVEVIDADYHLDTVIIPEKVRIDGKIYTVVGIGDAAFLDNSGLAYVNIPSTVTKIGDRAFLNLGNLRKVDIANGVTSIGSSAFFYCYNLAKIHIPSSVTAIGEDAFYGCSNLEVTIDNSINNVTLESDPFVGCKSVIWKQ